jgi:predicted metal-dependent hydrolase
MENLPIDFDWFVYNQLNEDLRDIVDGQTVPYDEEKSKMHYIRNGFFEGRKYKKEYNEEYIEEYIEEYDEEYDEESNEESNLDVIINKYKYIFHKYHLKLIDINESIPYKVICKNENIKNEFICHLHILNINDFENIYGEYISNLKNEFKIIITYSFGEIPPNLLYNDIDILLINNKGFDIGGKLCMLEYLKNENIEYNYLLFLHSKSNIESRKKYFLPFIKSIYRIKLVKILLKYKNICGVFPNVIHDNIDGVNITNYNEMIKLLNIKNDVKVFSEGNCFACNKKLINNVFKYDYKLWYNILNDYNSFDCNWVKIKYFLEHLNNYNNIYNYYRNNNCYGNNFQIINTYESYPDAMIEHVFERLWIVSIINSNDNYIVLDNNNLFEQYNINLNTIYFPQDILTNLLLPIEGFIEKYKNIYDLKTVNQLTYDNIININAWNEQTILEPNNITGNDNLNTINDIYMNS